MIITDRNKFKSWLYQNYWFEDGFISMSADTIPKHQFWIEFVNTSSYQEI